MARLPITIATWDYDRVRALVDGRFPRPRENIRRMKCPRGRADNFPCTGAVAFPMIGQPAARVAAPFSNPSNPKETP